MIAILASPLREAAPVIVPIVCVAGGAFVPRLNGLPGLRVARWCGIGPFLLAVGYSSYGVATSGPDLGIGAISLIAAMWVGTGMLFYSVGAWLATSAKVRQWMLELKTR